MIPGGVFLGYGSTSPPKSHFAIGCTHRKSFRLWVASWLTNTCRTQYPPSATDHETDSLIPSYFHVGVRDDNLLGPLLMDMERRLEQQRESKRPGEYGGRLISLSPAMFKSDRCLRSLVCLLQARSEMIRKRSLAEVVNFQERHRRVPGSARLTFKSFQPSSLIATSGSIPSQFI